MATIKLTKVRLSYPNLFEPREFEGNGKPKFSATGLFDRKHPANDIIKAAVLDAAKAKWGAKGEATLKALQANGRVFATRDGDNKETEGYAGHNYISASNSKRPRVMDSDGVTPLVDGDGKPYGGCHVNMWVDIYGHENGSIKGIYTNLVAIQFHSDGELLSNGSDAVKIDFTAVDDEEESLV